IRAWTVMLAGSAGSGDLLWICAAAALLIVPCRTAIRESRTDLVPAAPSLFCAWSLLAFYHDSSHMIMLLPVFVFLLSLDDPRTERFRWRFAAFLQVFLMYDVPNRLGNRLSDHPVLTVLALNFDRCLVIATFLYVAMLSERRSRDDVPVVDRSMG